MINDWGNEPPREADIPTSETYNPSENLPRNWRFSIDAQRAIMTGGEVDHKLGGFNKKIIEAINSRDVNRLIKVMDELDIAWMYPRRREIETQITGQSEDLVDFMNAINQNSMNYGSLVIYMSGGGASRLHIEVQNSTITVEPTQSSVPEFKTKWSSELK